MSTEYESPFFCRGCAVKRAPRGVKTPDNDDETRRRAITDMISQKINRELIKSVRAQKRTPTAAIAWVGYVSGEPFLDEHLGPPHFRLFKHPQDARLRFADVRKVRVIPIPRRQKRRR